MCGDHGHVAATCHQIWRYYRPVHPTKAQPVHGIERYCYNCAGAGHLGDDCTKPRPWHVQGGRIGVVVSAFGEGNVPEWAKLPNPPPKPAKMGKSAKRKGKVMEKEEQEEEDDDGWFGERLRGNEREPTRRKGPPKRAEYSLQREAIAKAAESKKRKPPPHSYSQSYRPQQDHVRGRSPLGNSYRPYHGSRDRAWHGERDWEAMGDRWRRDRDLDRLGR